MTKRAVIIFARENNVEQLVREVSDLIASKGGRVLYRKTSPQPIFVYVGGGVDHVERV